MTEQTPAGTVDEAKEHPADQPEQTNQPSKPPEPPRNTGRGLVAAAAIVELLACVGLPPNDRFDIADDIPYAAAPAITLEEALKRAFGERADLKAAEAQVHAAERSRSAARAERLPTVAPSADYGAIGVNPSQARGTFSVAGSLKFPIWQSGRIEGDIEQADAALAQRQAELEDLRSRAESDVRNAYLDLESARSRWRYRARTWK